MSYIKLSNLPEPESPAQIKKSRSGLLIIAGFSVIAMGITGLSFLTGSSESKTVSSGAFNTLSIVNAPDVLGVSDVNNQLQLVVVKTTEQNLNQTDAQLKKISVEVSITNTTPNTLQISPLLQMKLIDENGGSHDVTADFIGDKILGGPILSGQTYRETIDFITPVDTTAKSFTFAYPDLAFKQSYDLDL